MISIEENQQVYKEQVTWDKLEKRLTEMEDTFTNRINSLNQNILQLKQQLENRNASLPPYRGTQQVNNYNSNYNSNYNQNKQISASQKQKTFLVVLGLLILLVLGFVYYIIYFKPESVYDCRYFKPENLDYDESSWNWGSQLFTAIDNLFLSEKEHRKMYMERVYSIQKIHPQMLVNTATPFSNNFHIASNNLTLRYEVEEGVQQQILLIPSIKGPTFRVHVYIDTLLNKGDMGLGVVDQWTSSQLRSSMISGCAFTYSSDGCIHSSKASDYEESRVNDMKFIGDKLEEGMEVVMEVDVGAGTISFSLIGGSYHKVDKQGKWKYKPNRKYMIENSLLRQSGRRFVPYFLLSNRRDSIRWQII